VPWVAYREGDREQPFEIEHLAPALGQHDSEILGGLLSLSDAEIEDLTTSGRSRPAIEERRADKTSRS
jgi:hypothetical protein